VWQFSVHLWHSVFEWPGPAQFKSDLMMLQRLTERALPPESRAERPEKWHEVAGFEGF